MRRHVLPGLVGVLAVAALVATPHTADATVASTTTTVTYTGSGGTEFTVPFGWIASGDLSVVQITIATQAEATLVEDVDYTVERVGAEGGTVTTTNPITSDYQIKITRDTPRTQATSLRTQGRYLPSVLETALDKLTWLVQEALSGVSQSEDTAQAISDHISSFDDHEMYVHKNGRTGGQYIYGGTYQLQNLSLYSTTYTTLKGKVYVGDTLTVDEFTNLVGIMDTTPSYTLDVTGDIRATGNVYAVGTLYGSTSASGNLTIQSTSNATKGKVIFDTTTLVVDETNDRVGILTATPSYALEVGVSGMAYFGNSVYVDGWIYGGDGSGEDLTIQSTSHATKGRIEFGASDVMVVDEVNSRVGILDVTPSYELDVNGDTNVVGDVYVGVDLVAGTLYGGEASGNSLTIESTSHATKGDITIGNTGGPGIFIDDTQCVDIAGTDCVQAAYEFEVGGTASANSYFYADDGTLPVIWIQNDGNAATRQGVLMWVGTDTPSAGGATNVYFDLADGDGNSICTIENTNATTIAFVCPSDARLKMNIAPSRVNALETVNAIPVRQFDWRDEEKGHVDLGLVAQEVEPHWPQAVSERQDGTKTIATSELVLLQMKAIQELTAQVEALQEQVDENYWRCQEASR